MLFTLRIEYDLFLFSINLLTKSPHQIPAAAAPEQALHRRQFPAQAEGCMVCPDRYPCCIHGRTASTASLVCRSRQDAMPLNKTGQAPFLHGRPEQRMQKTCRLLHTLRNGCSSGGPLHPQVDAAAFTRRLPRVLSYMGALQKHSYCTQAY